MSNNKKVLSINGNPIKVNGNYVAIADTNLQDKVITPTAEPQVVMADEQYIGLNSVMVMSDDALVPENIKEGTSIFGVTGTYKATDVAFAIADGNTAPDTPSENMMWVQTDTEVSTFSIRSSIERPTDPAEGMVWVVNGQTSSGSFDILADENSLIVYPQKAYQYINGEWTARPIKIYKNGTWKDLFTATLNITYPEGSLCECTDGVITYTAPDRTGVWELIVPNPGTWITSGTEGEWEIIPVETTINANNENQNIELQYFNAFITVNYPSGTCTISLDDINLTHTGGGTHTFTVNKKGTWTVTATNNRGVSESANVSLTYRGQVSSVTLTCFDGYVYNTGDIYEEFTGGYSTVPLAAAALEFSTNYNGKLRVRANYGNNNPCAALTNNAIDITNYSRLRAIGDRNSNTAEVSSTVGVSSTRSVGGGLPKCTSISGSSTLDISGLSGPHYIGIWAPAYSGIAAVSKIWLE